jgi:hypothetical protein
VAAAPVDRTRRQVKSAAAAPARYIHLALVEAHQVRLLEAVAAARRSGATAVMPAGVGRQWPARHRPWAMAVEVAADHPTVPAAMVRRVLSFSDIENVS